MKKLAASFFITGGIIAFILLALGIHVASESGRSGFVIFLYFLIGAIFALMIFFAIGYTLTNNTRACRLRKAGCKPFCFALLSRCFPARQKRGQLGAKCRILLRFAF